MAREVVVVVRDDIDGSEGADEIQFGYKGTDYTIDLGPEHAGAFDEVMQSWIKHAAKAEVKRTGTRRRKGRNDLSDVRAWAADQGIKISARGRIPGDVMAKYEAAH